MIVVDASVIVDLLLRGPAIDAIEARLFRPGEALAAPELLDVEVTQVLRRFELAGELDGPRARQALDDLIDLPIKRYPHLPILAVVWTLRHNFTAYDGCYLALATALDAPMLTRDKKLAVASAVELV